LVSLTKILMNGITGNTNQIRSTKGIILLAAIIYFGINLSGLFVPVIENASKYAQVSREIIDNNDWVNLTIAREPYEQKPPLLFWIGALSYSILGVSFYAFKIPVLILSLLGIYSTYRLGKLLYNKNTGMLAAFFWGTSLGYFYFHNDIHTDTILVNFVILAIWQLTAFFQDKKWHRFFTGIVAIGFAMLTKGPVGLAIPVFALGIHLLMHRKYKEIFHIRWLLAAILVFVIISPALVGLYKQSGIGGLRFFFWTNNVGRITGEYRASGSDPFFYFHNLVLMASPWFMFVYPGLILEIRKYILKLFRKEKLQDSDEAVNIGGFILFFLVLTIASQKNPHYLMAILPLAMILAAKWTFTIFENRQFLKLRKTITIVNYIFPALVWPLLLIFLAWIYPERRAWFWSLCMIATAGYIFTLIKTKGLPKQLATLLIAQLVFFISLNVSIMPQMFENYSTFRACKIFNKEAGSNSRLCSYRLRYWSLFYYSKNYGEWIREGDRLREVVSEKTDWLYTDKPGLDVLNNWGVRYNIKAEFNHRNIMGQAIEFLNPGGSEKNFRKYYLIELTNQENIIM